MKRILIATNLITLTVLCYLLFNYSGNTSITVDGSYKVSSLPNFSSCYNCLTDDIHGETAQEFADVTARYRTTHFTFYNALAKNQLTATGMSVPNYNKSSTFQDSRSCWFSADTVKKFICLMEKYAATINIPSSDLGVRFYYANYDNVNVFDPNFANHHTLYLVPTAYDTKTGAIVDFEPRKSASTGNLVYLSNFINDTLPGFGTQNLMIVGGMPSLFQSRQTTPGTVNISTNQGDLCPPSTGCNPTLTAIDQTHAAPYY